MKNLCARVSLPRLSRSFTSQAYRNQAVAVDQRFDYLGFYHQHVQAKKDDKSYRYLTNVNRMAPKFPYAHLQDRDKEVVVWCTTDYLGMTTNQHVIDTMHEVLDQYGAGSGGSRSVSGHNVHLTQLEDTLARLHGKESALVFTSGFIANDATLATIASRLPNCTILSDVQNHGSIIAGVTHSRAKKMIFKHNDADDLEAKLQALPYHDPKIIAFESLYSISGQVAPVAKFCELATKYNALTFMDETHAVGMYGPHGGGVASHLNFSSDANKCFSPSTTTPRTDPAKFHVDIITASLAKAYGSVGGYIAGPADLTDMVRSLSPSFIFTTTLPPPVAAGCRAAVHHLMTSPHERRAQHAATLATKLKLARARIPVYKNHSHILPVLIGDPAKARRASDLLLERYGIYGQNVGFPTVPRGREILRLSATNGHGPALQDQLVRALDEIWDELGIKRVEDWKRGDGVDVEFTEVADVARSTIWTPEQLDFVPGGVWAGGEGSSTRRSSSSNSSSRETSGSALVYEPLAEDFVRAEIAH